MELEANHLFSLMNPQKILVVSKSLSNDVYYFRFILLKSLSLDDHLSNKHTITAIYIVYVIYFVDRFLCEEMTITFHLFCF